jgi:hypothetical protein
MVREGREQLKLAQREIDHSTSVQSKKFVGYLKFTDDCEACHNGCHVQRSAPNGG